MLPCLKHHEKIYESYIYLNELCVRQGNKQHVLIDIVGPTSSLLINMYRSYGPEIEGYMIEYFLSSQQRVEMQIR